MKEEWLLQKERNEFEELVKPLMKWMAENLHPHTKIIIEANSAVLVEGILAVSTNEFIVD